MKTTVFVVIHDDFERGPLQDFCIGVFKTLDKAIDCVKEISDFEAEIQIDPKNPFFVYAQWDTGAATIEEHQIQ